MNRPQTYAERYEEEQELNRIVEMWAKEELVRWHTKLARRGFPRMDPHDARNWFPVEMRMKEDAR